MLFDAAQDVQGSQVGLGFGGLTGRRQVGFARGTERDRYWARVTITPSAVLPTLWATSGSRPKARSSNVRR